MQHDWRDVVIYAHGGGIRHITDQNAVCDPLHFVLLFPQGEPGWEPGIPHVQHPAPRYAAPSSTAAGDATDDEYAGEEEEQEAAYQTAVHAAAKRFVDVEADHSKAGSTDEDSKQRDVSCSHKFLSTHRSYIVHVITALP
jgi:hypothetical protein